MRRALDAAILELGALGDRDQILACFFEHARSLFDFCALFVVRGPKAEGRHVHGLGAPPGLVARLVVPLEKPGMLTKAKELKRPFVAANSAEEMDRTLFGMLGRVLPNALVIPLLVKDRVVAILVGEPAQAALGARAASIGRAPIELAKEDAMMLAEATGNTLERLILRKKNVHDSLLPPSFSSQPPVGMGVPAMPVIPRAPAAPLFAPAGNQPGTPAPMTAEPGALAAQKPAGSLVPLAAALALLVIGGATGFWLWRGERRADRHASVSTSLENWPKVEPLSALEPARKASDLDGRVELGVIEAEIGDDGRVDFTKKPDNAGGLYLRFEFLADDLKSEVVVDSSGLHSGNVQRREKCGERSCQRSVPPPKCTIPTILAGAKRAGLEPGDRTLVRYAPSSTDSATAEWQLSIAGRGSIHIDAATCQPLAGEQLTPKALPIDKIPGAPSAVDALGIISLARAQSGLTDAALLELDMTGVMESGNVDLNAPDANIAYVFAEPTGQQRRRWRRVQVRRDGIPIVSDERDNSPMPVRLYGLTTAMPRCTAAQAREYLLLGTLAPGPARMTYGPGVGGSPSGSGEWSIESVTLASRKTASDSECEAWATAYGKKPPPTPKKGK